MAAAATGTPRGCDRADLVRHRVCGALGAALGGPLPAGPTDSAQVVESLARGADVGLVVTNAGRYFGFVRVALFPRRWRLIGSPRPGIKIPPFRVVTRCRRG
jgi:hypothetical protein